MISYLCICNIYIYISGPAKPDKLVFHYMPCKTTNLQPKDAFKEQAKTRNFEALKLPISIVSADDIPYVRLNLCRGLCGSTHEIVNVKR